jgi:hypothetical protein
MTVQFLEFVDRKQRESKKHLKLIEQLLRKNGIEVYSHIEKDEEPYIFVKSSDKNLSFEGIRIFEIGNMIAYRVQKQEKTHPYGKSYLLGVEDMFNDYMSENMSEQEAGKKVIQSVKEEIQKFFEKSAKAEAEMNDVDLPRLVIKTGGSDYSSTVLNKL